MRVRGPRETGGAESFAVARWSPVVLTLLVSVLFSACIGDPAVPDCVRYDAVSPGPENDFRIEVPADSAPTLQGENDRLELAMTLLPPVDGPVILSHWLDGREMRRWSLDVEAGASPAARCRLGTSSASSNCGAMLDQLPVPTGGQWHLDVGRNRVLEAGLAFRTCR